MGRKSRWALVVAGVILGMGSMSSARAGEVLFISDGSAIDRYDFSSATLTSGFITDNTMTFTGLAIGPNGNLFAGTTSPVPEVFQYDPNTGVQSGLNPYVAFLPPGSPNPANVENPAGMRFGSDGLLYVSDITSSNINIYDSTGTSVAHPTSPELDQPSNVGFNGAGVLFVPNPGFADVLKYDSGTQTFSEFTSPGAGGLANPVAIAFDSSGKLDVLDETNNDILQYNADGSFNKELIGLDNAGIFQAQDMQFGPDGRLYVSGISLTDSSGEVVSFLSDGTSEGTLFSTGLTQPTFMAFANVPEPASAGIALALGGWMLMRRRGRFGGGHTVS